MPLSYELQLFVLIVVTLFLAAKIAVSEIRAARNGKTLRTSVRFWNVSALLILSGFIFFVIMLKIDSDEFMPKCVRSDDPAFIELHLKAGGNPNMREASGNTLLMIAAGIGSPKVVRCLLAYGADPTLRNGKERTALDAAQEGWRLFPENQAYYEDTILALRNAPRTGK